MASQELPGTPKGYSAPKADLEKKFKIDGQNALSAMKRRMGGLFGDESSPAVEMNPHASYPGKP